MKRTKTHNLAPTCPGNPDSRQPRPSWRNRIQVFGLYLTVGFISLSGALNGCYRNPATGKEQLSLIGESQEIEMGRQANEQITQSIGLYPDSGWQDYIQQLGESMAKKSERPDLPWQFRVVDDASVNAFALPGGFIYVTRGILTHFNNEAELAGVIGHEIGHVTAKHSVNQMSKQQLAQVGLVAGMVIDPRLQRYGQLASAGLQLLFLKFSRDDEKEADDLGFRYMQTVNYDPRELVSVFGMLSRVSQAAGAGRMPEWLATHPNPENRQSRISKRLDTMNLQMANLNVGRESYLKRINGLVFGDNPREGYFRGATFFQPELQFRLEFPSGWQTVNQKQAVIGVSGNQDAAMQVTLAEGRSASAAAQTFFQQQGLQASDLQSVSINNLPAVAGRFTAQTEQGEQVAGAAVFVEHRGNVYQLLGFAGGKAWPRYETALLNSLQSFDELTDPQALNVQPMRLEVVTVNRDMTLEQFAEQNPSSVPIETLELINQIDRGDRLRSGQLIKRVVGGSGTTIDNGRTVTR